MNYKRASKRLTDYGKRYRLLRSGRPRLVIRFTNRQIIMQLVYYDKQNAVGDRVAATWTSRAVSDVPYRTNYGVLKALYQLVRKNLPADYIIDTGLRNNSEKLKKLFKDA